MLKTIITYNTGNLPETRVAVPFGTGNILMDKSIQTADDNSLHAVVDLFYTNKPRGVGSVQPRAHSNDKDYIISLSFSNVQSIDTLIKMLQMTRDTYWQAEIKLAQSFDQTQC